jgi:hypothetical protein
MFLYSGNLNVPEKLRAYTRTPFVSNAEKALDALNLHHHAYITTQKVGGQVHFNQGSIHARSSATNYALTNTVSTLLEIRGVGLGRTSFKRRIQASFSIAISYLRTAVIERDQLQTVISSAIQDTSTVVVISKPAIKKEVIKAIDVATEKDIDLEVTLHNALESSPVLLRRRPYAYILKSTESAAVERLSILGLKIDTLKSEKEITVELCTASGNDPDLNAEVQEEEYEGEAQISKNSLLKVSKRKFAPGTFIIYLQQKRANLAVEILEPESSDGFVSANVIKAREGEELPVYRYMQHQQITN